MMHLLPLSSTNSQLFKYAVTSEMQAMLHQLDRDAAGKLLTSEDALPGDAREKYIVHSLRQEAISSSLLEGAATTRDQAKDMLRNGRKPRNDGERRQNCYLCPEHLLPISPN